ncbi:hypothetical protein [Thermoanaerobacter mathranii]|uniref:hypothetical protein n=1 Tax=Thermoanaerobacter mathranii TaxID=583357 RepID=UPI003D6A2624
MSEKGKFYEKFRLKRGYAKNLWEQETYAYQIVKIPENIIVAHIYPWDVFYPKKMYNVFLKEFRKIGNINYVVVLTGLTKCFETETLKEAKEWLGENWDDEKFNFANKQELSPVIYIPEIIQK